MGSANSGSFTHGPYRTLTTDGASRQFIELDDCRAWAQREMERTNQWAGVEERDENGEWWLIETVNTPEEVADAALRAPEQPSEVLIANVLNTLNDEIATPFNLILAKLEATNGDADLVKKALDVLQARGAVSLRFGFGFTLKDEEED